MSPSALVRSWPALAAWGAGLVELGLGAGAIVKGADAADRGIGILLATVGATTLVWGVITLSRGRVAPRSGAAVSLVGIVALAAVMLAGPRQMSIYPVVVSMALALAVGVVSAVALRRAGRGRAHPVARTAARTSVGGLIVGAFLLAGLVTPALAATPIGSDAPGASVNEVFMPGHGH
ncbi:hypothetical protein E1I21_03385 [Microbacterium oleivorans]|uniref:Uncharacterized protein n=1 Tax=Microbacterium oleivorans TaxID=273677 RepID=A0A031FXC6_9MICO|nr:hypothetical protein [Microbacterium oleivorans]AZS45018.1 hypothetical protein BWL13_02616 [Microbacterium oleivorans]EZP29208.1 hypothetical protein BW34_00725 [Microbacterium oleivorans]THE08349.1 hypothetical protein E1I21_03385 [Microbacterium oleivorans]